MSATMKLPELFGSLVFNEETMKDRLSSASYERLEEVRHRRHLSGHLHRQ